MKWIHTFLSLVLFISMPAFSDVPISEESELILNNLIDDVLITNGESKCLDSSIKLKNLPQNLVEQVLEENIELATKVKTRNEGHELIEFKIYLYSDNSIERTYNFSVQYTSPMIFVSIVTENDICKDFDIGLLV